MGGLDGRFPPQGREPAIAKCERSSIGERGLAHRNATPASSGFAHARAIVS